MIILCNETGNNTVAILTKKEFHIKEREHILIKNQGTFHILFISENPSFH